MWDQIIDPDLVIRFAPVKPEIVDALPGRIEDVVEGKREDVRDFRWGRAEG